MNMFSRIVGLRGQLQILLLKDYIFISRYANHERINAYLKYFQELI